MFLSRIFNQIKSFFATRNDNHGPSRDKSYEEDDIYSYRFKNPRPIGSIVTMGKRKFRIIGKNKERNHSILKLTK